MKYRKLGRTDIEVSVVCLGGWSLIGDSTWGYQDEADSIAAIHAAVDAGVTFFDTAEVYGDGESERLLGRALAEVRQNVVVASKVSASRLRPSQLKAACEASLRRLKMQTIDLYQVHWPSGEVPIAETLGAMAELKAAGKIRAIGVSNFGASYLKELLTAGSTESNQLCYSLLWRPIEVEVQSICAAADVGILCYSPLCQGLLTGKFSSADEVPASRARTRLFSKDRPQSRHAEVGCEEELFKALAEIRRICRGLGQPMGRVALAWLLSQPGVTSVIAGARNAGQAAENSLAADLELSAEVIGKLSSATEALKAYAGGNADLWQTDSRMDPKS